ERPHIRRLSLQPRARIRGGGKSAASDQTPRGIPQACEKKGMREGGNEGRSASRPLWEKELKPQPPMLSLLPSFPSPIRQRKSHRHGRHHAAVFDELWRGQVVDRLANSEQRRNIQGRVAARSVYEGFT